LTKRLNVPQEYWMHYDSRWNLDQLRLLVQWGARDFQQDLSWPLRQIRVRVGDSQEKVEAVNALPSK
jgi:hypothetical protein